MKPPASCSSLSGHPRVCGENDGNDAAKLPITGPSPRVRGERSATLAAAASWAGHPRVCGENP